MTHARIGKKIPPGLSLDVEFQLAPGVTALFGSPGSGKTLILESIAGFVRPDSGRILVDDVILFDAGARVDIPPRRRNCGYIFQRDALFPHISLRQNLMFAAHRWPRLERHRRVSEMLERFQLSGAAASKPGDLAPPLRLLASFARALIAEPKLLLIDDRPLDEALLRQVRAICPSPILLVTRDLDLCCAAAGHLIVLDAGRILQRGAPRQVLAEPESVEVARLLGIPNLFQGAIASLDPGRNSSLLEFERFSLAAPYIKGHFRGDRVWVAVRPGDLRVHAGDAARQPNIIPAQLVRVSQRTRTVRLEFSDGIFADLSLEEFERQKDNRSWQVEFPPEALHIL